MILLDYQDRRPIYEQIMEKFEVLIMNGALKPLSKLPSVRSLAVELSINPNTIQKAYMMLEQKGLIYPIKGKGNFVSDNDEVWKTEREAYKEGLKKVVVFAKERGIGKEEFVETAATFYEEVTL